jgi:hypothetical protein
MSQRISNVYFSLNEDGTFRFPEQENMSVDPTQIAIAISGGGTRSMTCAAGHIRALLRFDPDFLQRSSYISGISGGSWFSTLLVTSKLNTKTFIGESIKIHDINRHTLNTTNYYDVGYIGNMISNFDVGGMIYRGYSAGNKASKLWDFTCSALILDPYGLDDLTLANSRDEAKANYQFNNVKSTFPKPGYPFLISGVATLDDGADLTHDDTELFEFTPMYQGIRVPNRDYGGILFSNTAFGCNFKELNYVTDRPDILTVNRDEAATIETSIASSSAAFAIEALKLRNSIIPFSKALSKIRMTTKVWGFTSKEEHKINLMDGTFFDYTGVISLAARGCKKILAFLNCGEYNRNYCNFGITHLFGIDDEFKCTFSELHDKIQIFSLEDWIQMRKDFEKRIEEGKIAYFHRKMNVMHNWRAGVNGGYETEVLFIPLFENKDFFDQLPIDIHSDDFPELNNMPNIPYIFGNDDRALELSASQVNFLSTYCDWYLTKIIEELPDFFA